MESLELDDIDDIEVDGPEKRQRERLARGKKGTVDIVEVNDYEEAETNRAKKKAQQVAERNAALESFGKYRASKETSRKPSNSRISQMGGASPSKKGETDPDNLSDLLNSEDSVSAGDSPLKGKSSDKAVASMPYTIKNKRGSDSTP